ncbi:MAG: peptide deformylase [Treponema sp.]|jgi:peptide deformylase|nr:peptide deformylase [Treponema sp.]
MQIVTLGSELLRQKAEKIEQIDDEVTALANKMLEIVKTDNGIGLAGPQIGVNRRIFVTHINNDEKRIFINPSIIETSLKTCKYEEGCLSIPGIYSNVIRCESIKIQAWNEKGRPFTLEANGLLARVILHEYDHLEGTLFIDRLPENKRKKLVEKYENLNKAEKT